MTCEGCEIRIRTFVLMTTNREQYMEFLYQHGIFKKEILCQKCGAMIKLKPSKLTYRCGRSVPVPVSAKKAPKRQKCGFQASARKKTFFESRSLSIEDIGYFAVLWCMFPYPKQQFLQDELNWSTRTVVEWGHFCRQVCVNWARNCEEKIGGEGVVIEVDMAEFKKQQAGNSSGDGEVSSTVVEERQLVFAGIERGDNKGELKPIFLVPIAQPDKDTLLSVLREKVAPGTTIISDFWKVQNIGDDEGFKQLKTSHSLNFVDPEDPGVHMLTIKRLWRDVREAIPRYGKKTKYIAGYLSEFLFKRTFGKHLVHQFFIEAAEMNRHALSE